VPDSLPGTPVEDAVPDGHSYALLLTHDVDRPYKTYQSLYYGLAEPSRYHLRTLVSRDEPYWQFEDVMALEDELGVRSAFYLLDEQHLLRDRPVREWLSPSAWQRYLGRYSLDDPAIQRVVRDLDRGGWEVGLHGSYRSYDDRDRLRTELRRVEELVGHEVVGVRQHYLNLDVPDTWRHHRALGLDYDTSLGSSETVGFRHGHRPLRPFDDEFVVFPLTMMENALFDHGGDVAAAWEECEAVLDEAREERAVATVLWHPRVFNEREFPGYRRLYRRLVERALDDGAWVGPPADLHARLDHPDRGNERRGTADPAPR
jgi:hypothetical protein